MPRGNKETNRNQGESNKILMLELIFFLFASQPSLSLECVSTCAVEIRMQKEKKKDSEGEEKKIK